MSYVCTLTMQHSLKDRLKSSLQRSKESVFLRRDFDRFGDYRQVSRALGELEKENVLKRAGYGLYTRAASAAPIDELVGKIRARLGKRVKRTIVIDDIPIALGRRFPVAANAQGRLDQIKLHLAQAIVERFDMPAIRAKSLANLERWRSQGVWCSAYDEWRALMQRGSDRDVRKAMTGTDETANRLRQSPPYTGLLDQAAVHSIREAAGA